MHGGSTVISIPQCFNNNEQFVTILLRVFVNRFTIHRSHHYISIITQCKVDALDIIQRTLKFGIFTAAVAEQQKFHHRVYIKLLTEV